MQNYVGIFGIHMILISLYFDFLCCKITMDFNLAQLQMLHSPINFTAINTYAIIL